MAYCDIHPIIADCLSIRDEVGKRVISFVYSCVSHDSELIKSVVRSGVLLGRVESQLGRNILLSLKTYRMSLTKFMTGSLPPSFVAERACKSQFETTRTQARLLKEAVEL